MIHHADIKPRGELHLPGAARHVRVFQSGRKLVGPLADPAADTCPDQSSFVRSYKDQTIMVEWVKCWGSELDNFSRRKVVVWWTS